MNINKEMFREYDVRGIADTDMPDDVVRAMTFAHAAYLDSSKPVIVGCDNRVSSPRIHRVTVDILVESGYKVLDIGVVATPIFYFAHKHLDAQQGIMITASHNPKDFNGFKVFKGEATIYGAEIQKIMQMTIDGVKPPATKPGSTEKIEIHGPYQATLKEKIQLARPLHVVVCCGNGVGALDAEIILKSWGCKVTPLHCESDGTFPNHTADPVKEANMIDVIEKVREVGADVGIGFDGDADRVGIVDETGSLLYGDQLMILLYREFLAKHPGEKALVEVKQSQALWDDIVAHGGKPMFWKTGHSLIKAKMAEEEIKIAGEMSGHIFLKDEYYGFDDGFYAAGRILRLLAASDSTMSELLKDAPSYFATPELRPYCPDNRKFQIMEEILASFKKTHEVIDVDGARVLFDDGWGLIRVSNTQPALIVRAEGTNENARDRILDALQNTLKQYPEVGDLYEDKH